jgi:origin recognition complex subunit 2
VLSRICSLKNVHLIASIDKVNAGIMFDNKTLGDYNFIWMNCTNYEKYIIETKFLEPLVLKNTKSVNALSALRSFFRSLTENAKRILMILIRDCIKNKTNKKYEGVKFSTLYDWCRKEFLVSSDLALRSQLVEFVDHEIIKWKHDIDILQFSVDVDILIEFFLMKKKTMMKIEFCFIYLFSLINT